MISRANAEECIPNIGPEEQKKRITIGTTTVAIGAALAVYLLASGAPRPWRLLVLLPFWAGAIGLFQVKEKTCVALSARGMRNMDAGDEVMTNAAELEQVRAQARKVHIEAFVTAVLLTLLVALFPGK
jgi:hypothetical protein